MKKTAIVLLLIAISCVATAKQHKKKTTSTDQIVSVQTYHTACFGHCPQFSVEVNRDGSVTYTGIRFAHDSGVYVKSIGKAKAKKLIDRFITFRADTCKDRYESRMQDLPGINITIKYQGRTKTIQNSNLGPFGLIKISAPIDSLANTRLDNTWRRVVSSEGQ